jgi:hypothetical protein
MSKSKSNSSSSGSGNTPNWDSAPVPLEADLTKISQSDRISLLKNHIDEGKARDLVQRLDGSADDYDRNMVRIDQWIAGIQQALGTAIKIAAVV